MAPAREKTVPQDMWICGECGGENLIPLADEQCPICRHVRDGCCLGPGDYYPKYGGYSPDHSDEAADPHTSCSGPSVYTPYGAQRGLNSEAECVQPCNTQAPFIGNPAQPNDIWTCSECGATNCDWYDLCPVCNKGTRTAMPGNITVTLAAFRPAGSPAPGSWVCSNCGASNSSLTPNWCPLCGASAS